MAGGIRSRCAFLAELIGRNESKRVTTRGQQINESEASHTEEDLPRNTRPHTPIFLVCETPAFLSVSKTLILLYRVAYDNINKPPAGAGLFN